MRLRNELEPLGWTRAAIGALILLRTTPLLAPLDIWYLRDAVPLLGWPEAGFGVATLPRVVLIALCLVRTLAALLLMLGVWTRPAGVVCGLCGYVLVVEHPFGFFFTIHLLYQAALLLGLSDAGCAFALRPDTPRSPSSSYLLIRLFLISIYFWAGFFKLRPDWFDGRTLELFRRPGALYGPFADLLFATPLSRRVVATGTALFELAIGPLLLWPRSRRYAVPLAFAFHFGIEVTAHPDMLGFGMAALLLSFLPPQRATGAARRARSRVATL